MDIRIQGRQKLSGKITPSGGKNSAVAVIPATLLVGGVVNLSNVPDITDVEQLVVILESVGSKIDWDRQNGTMKIDNSGVRLGRLGRKGYEKIRGTSLLWGPVLGRFRKLNFDDIPHGCSLGKRPLDAHYKAFRDLGVRVEESARRVEMRADKPQPGNIWLSETSPTATENAVMFAVTLPGTTTITGAASEPQVPDTCNFLKKAGAKIDGIGSNNLTIQGGYPLHGVDYRLLSDHYEIATFLAIGAMTGGKVQVSNYEERYFTAINYEFSKVGVKIVVSGNTATAVRDVTIPDDRFSPIMIKPHPWPGLPVDLLPLYIALALSQSSRRSYLFHNWMYEGGLFWALELQKFGANITLCGPHRVLINTGGLLSGATVASPYIIRAAVALVLVAMIAEGTSIILNADALRRGHPRFVENLRHLGAKIEEV